MRTNSSLSDIVSRNFVGFEPLLRYIENIDVGGFPPHNIEKLDEQTYRLTLAVAGFSKENLNIETKDGNLTVTGTGLSDNRNFLYRGIANRDFSRVFKISDNVRVEEATLENGMLTIVLHRLVPEEEKSKVIKIK